MDRLDDAARLDEAQDIDKANLGAAQPSPSGAWSHFTETTDRMSLRGLTDAAGVSVRTVRYYIAEGLLPPPAGSGPASSYTASHLDRLRLIQRLKADYLPLREIRRRLSGLADEDVRALVNSIQSEPSPDTALEAPMDLSMAGARQYLGLMESGQAYRTEPLGLTLAPDPATPPPPASPPRSRRRALVKTEAATQEAQRGVRASETSLWHRIALGEEAELVISDDAYARHPDRVDWLVRWARKVFD
jgi:DNA-binding transcriptional MerR regulator